MIGFSPHPMGWFAQGLGRVTYALELLARKPSSTFLPLLAMVGFITFLVSQF